MLDNQVYAFCLVAGVLTITPGADTLLVFRNTIRGGQRHGVMTALGVCTGLFGHATLSALGLSAIVMMSATLFDAMKLMGAAYLVWLGIQSFRGTGEWNAAGDQSSQVIASHRSFREGFLCNVLNPKVAVFYLAFLPQFIGPDDPAFGKAMFLAGIHYVMGVLWLGVVAKAVAAGRASLARPRVRVWLNRFSGSALIALGIRLMLSKR